MDLNENVLSIVLEFESLCRQEKWNAQDRKIRAVYDTFRIQNILNNSKE